MRPGDVLIGLPSPNLRSNGYSLARKALLEVDGRSLDDEAYKGAHHSLADELLSPSVIYAPAILELLRHVDVHAVSPHHRRRHPRQPDRVLPERCDAVVQRRSFETPRIFTEIQRIGEIPDEEMAATFNLGLGMIVVVPPSDVYKALDVLRSAGHRAVQVGEVVDGGHRQGAPCLTPSEAALSSTCSSTRCAPATSHSSRARRVRTSSTRSKPRAGPTASCWSPRRCSS